MKKTSDFTDVNCLNNPLFFTSFSIPQWFHTPTPNAERWQNKAMGHQTHLIKIMETDNKKQGTQQGWKFF